MKKLEGSVRKAMHYYMSDLKAGRYWPAGAAGMTPQGFRGFISTAVADVVDGLCTDITIYTVGDAEERRHYYMEEGVVSITAAICEWLEDPADYDSLIDAICSAISKAPREDDECVGDMIPLAQYAEMHNRNPASARQRALRGGFKTAIKVGRDWMIRADEPYGDLRLASERKV